MKRRFRRVDIKKLTQAVKKSERRTRIKKKEKIVIKVLDKDIK